MLAAPSAWCGARRLRDYTDFVQRLVYSTSESAPPGGSPAGESARVFLHRWPDANANMGETLRRTALLLRAIVGDAGSSALTKQRVAREFRAYRRMALREVRTS